MHKVEIALAGIGRRFINPFGSRLDRRVNDARFESDYSKAFKSQRRHGEREVSRRLRQECMKLMKAQIVRQGIDTLSGKFGHITKWDELASDPEAYVKFRTSPSAKLLELRDYLKTEAA